MPTAMSVGAWRIPAFELSSVLAPPSLLHRARRIFSGREVAARTCARQRVHLGAPCGPITWWKPFVVANQALRRSQAGGYAPHRAGSDCQQETIRRKGELCADDL